VSEKIALSVADTAELLSLSPPTVYELMRREDFPAFKLGKRTLVSRQGLDEWVQKQAAQSGSINQ
jgi:excisionase family DNA binding protein